MSPIPAPEITIADRKIGLNQPTYFIADIAANHDGDLDRAKMLIRLAGFLNKLSNYVSDQIYYYRNTPCFHL